METYFYNGINSEGFFNDDNWGSSVGKYIDNTEYLQVTLDKEDKVLEGIQNDGTKVISGDLNVGGNTRVKGNVDLVNESIQSVNNTEYLKVTTDTQGKILCGIKNDGTVYIPILDNPSIDSKLNEAIQEFKEKAQQIEDDINAKLALYDEIFSYFDSINDTDERSEITTDSEGKVISYRDSDGVKHEEVGIETDMATVNHLNLTEHGMAEFQQALRDSGFKPGGGGDFSDKITKKGKDPVYIPIPRCASLNILSNIDLTTLSKAGRGDAVQKVNYDVKVQVEFFDGQGIYFKKWALIGAQGNSSMAFDKKNIAVKIFDTEDVEGKKKKWGKGDTFGIKFGDWVMQTSFHLKSYYTDYLRGSGIIAYQLAENVYKTRGVYEDRPWKKALIDFNQINSSTPAGLSEDGISDLSLQIDNGARCMPDGFPVMVYQQGEFYGIFSWQIKKDAANYHLEEDNANQIHLDGTLNISNFWGGINWNEFEIRVHEDLVTMTGDDYDGDNPSELIDETAVGIYDPSNKYHVKSAKVKKYIKELVSHTQEINILNATDPAAAKNLFDTYFDADNLIDYQLINMACGDTDGFGKNWQWITYDGVKWWVCQYDKDMSFGNLFTGMCTTPVRRGWIDNTVEQPSGLAIRYYQAEHKARWNELVNAGIFTADHIKSLIISWINRIGENNYKKEWERWSEAPCNRDSKIDFENWRFTGRYTDRTPQSGIFWNDTTEYAPDDVVWFKVFDGEWHLEFKAVKSNTNKPCLTSQYIRYPHSMGYRDSVWRFFKYIEQTIVNQNSFINNLNV